MARWLWTILFIYACVYAEDLMEERKSKLPFIADAVGNPLPPPKNGLATVGSPVKLLTPDRYEFYTFDESGELIKRLMTLEEIQAIVAAGEGSEGHFVTFSNDNEKPPITFNYSQAPFTKVHSVVTNVQNVLKAQMEAQKNNPPISAPLDTPDVSDSWSLILPTIFGNTGADIIPDKSSSTHTMPDTETIEYDNLLSQYEDNISKEGEGNILNTETTDKNVFPEVIIQETTQKAKITNEIPKTTSPTTSIPKITTTSKSPSKFSMTPTTTIKPTTTTQLPERKPITSSSQSTTKESTTTQKTVFSSHASPRPTNAVTKPSNSFNKTTMSATKLTKPTEKPLSTTRKPFSSTSLSSIATKPSTTIYKLSSLATYPSTNAPKPFSKPQEYTSVHKLSTSHGTSTLSPNKPTVVRTTTPKPASIHTTSISKESVTSSNKIQSTTKYQLNSFSSSLKANNSYTYSSTSGTTKTPDKSSSKLTTVETGSFIPMSTIAYVSTERTTAQSTKKRVQVSSTTKRSVISTYKTTTSKPKLSTKTPIPVTTYKPTKFTKTPLPSTTESYEKAKYNKSTTVTTQSVSPSTTVSSTEFMSTEKKTQSSHVEEKRPVLPDLPLAMFDMAQSFSQIASDLGNNYQVLNSSNLLNANKVSDLSLESKESVEIEIPNDSKNISASSDLSTTVMPENDSDGFVKITTFEPHDFVNNKINSHKTNSTTITNQDDIPSLESKEEIKTTIDPVLSESMDDLLSQVVNQVPDTILASTLPPTKIEPTTLFSTTEYVQIKNRFKPSPVTEKVLSSTLTDSVTKVNTKANYEQKHNKSTTKTETYGQTKAPNIQESLSTKPTLLMKDTTATTKLNSIIPEQSTEHVTVNQISEVLTTDIHNNPSTEAMTTASKITNKWSINSFRETTTPKILVTTTKENIEQKLNKTETINSHDNKLTSLNLTKTENNKNDQIKDNSINSQMNKNPSNIQTNITRAAIDKIEPLSLVETQQLNDMQNISSTAQITYPNIESTTIKTEDFKKKIQKVNIDDKELVNNRNSTWKLIPTMAPPNEISKDKVKTDNAYFIPQADEGSKEIDLEVSKENQGLEMTTKDLGEDILQFTDLCNELAFRYWHSITAGIDTKRSFVLSPYAITSMLTMMFMGARGATSGEMNEILKLDDMVTFNPHFTLKNISDSIETTAEAGVAISAFVRELYSDRNKGKILTFYKERAQHFYSGHVEEINFKLISDIIRRRTNLLVKRHTWGKVAEYMKTNSIILNPPLAALSVNVFQTDCTGSSVDGRDGEMYFVVSPTVRQRRLVPVPSVVYRKGFLAGYDPVLDATAAALGSTNSIISTLFVMPGQQGNVVHAEDLEALEKRLLSSSPTIPVWNRMLRTLLPRIGLELQIPRFSHKSVFNVSSSLKTMGLNGLFDANHADLGGLTGPSKELYLSDMVQQNSFVTCGEGIIGEQHHIEEYPETLEVIRRRRTSRWSSGWDEPRDYQRAFHDPHDAGEAMHLPLHLRPRQARLPARDAQPARLKFDRPFLFFVRHNPSGMILYFGRYNPRLLP